MYYFDIHSTDLQCLVTAGNDCKINIWNGTRQIDQNIKYELHHTIMHDSKINWITCSSFQNDSVFVADQSSNIIVYELK